MRKAGLLLLILFTFSLIKFVSAQEYKAQSFFELSHRRGYNKPHRDIIMNLDYPYRSADFKLGWQSRGEKEWQAPFRYPRYGIGLNWGTFKTDTIGNPMALYFFMQFPQFSYKRFHFDIEFDFGASYGINPYDAVSNPNNKATGTSTNMFYSMFLQQGLHLSNKWDFHIGEGIVHYSNGALGVPNIGFNVFGKNVFKHIPEFALEFGLSYTPNTVAFKPKTTLPSPPKKWTLSTYAATGMRRPSNKSNVSQKLPVYNWVVVSPQILKRFSYKHRAGFGMEIGFNEYIESWNRDYKILDKTSVAIVGVHEFMLNKFVITNQLGIYLYNKYDTPYYERIGFGYYLTKYLRVNLNLKAQAIVAEYFEIGFNYDLPFKN